MGLLLLAAALVLTGYNLREDTQAEAESAAVLEAIKAEIPTVPQKTPDMEESIQAPSDVPEAEEVIPDYVLNPEMEMPVLSVDGQNYIGVLAIPALSLSLPVIGDWSYPKLKRAPCRYSGSAYQDDLILMAHNYSSHFGRLSSLPYGSLVTFTDADGNVFAYQVAELEVLNPHAIEDMKSGEWDLTLFTCTIGGKSRVTVRCERIAN